MTDNGVALRHSRSGAIHAPGAIMRTVRHAFTLIELLVVIAIIAILMALLLPAVQYAREAARRTQCRSNLKQIGLALHNYHDIHRVLPPGFVSQQGWLGASNRNQFGWAVMVLPQLEQSNLYNRFNFNLANWNNVILAGGPTETNWTLSATKLPVFRCPSDIASDTIDRSCPPLSGPIQGTSNYSGATGIRMTLLPCGEEPKSGIPGASSMMHPPTTPCVPSEGAFYINSSVRLGDVTDGTSNTIAVGEVSWKYHFHRCLCCPVTWKGGTVWAGIFPLDRGEHVLCETIEEFNDEDKDGIGLGFSSLHTGGANFLLLDGSVRFVSQNIDSQKTSPWGTFQNLSTISGNEVQSEF